MAALSSLSVSKTLSVVLTWPGLIPLPPAQQTGALSAELTRRQFCKVMRVKDTPKKWKWPDYSGTPLYGHLYIKDSFVCSDIKRSKFFSKINPLNTDTIACPVGVRINGVPLVLKAQRLVSYKIYPACTIRMQTSAFRDKKAVVIWSLFGHVWSRKVRFVGTFIAPFLVLSDGNGLKLN